MALLVSALHLFSAHPAAAAWGPVESRAKHGELVDAVALLQTAQQPRLEPQGAGIGEEERGDGVGNESFVPGKVLVFWSVGSTDRAMDLVKRNVAILRDEVRRARHSSSPLHVDVFLAHYDLKRILWVRTREQREWYAENVQFTAQEQGYKMKLVNLFLLNGGMPHGPKTFSYEWLWLLDEDADFSRGTSLQSLVQEARSSGALILGPAVILPPSTASEVSMDRQRHNSSEGCQPGTPLCKLAAPHPSCRYRYTNFVEVMFTFLKPAALRAALVGCPDLWHRSSVWGLDKTWCSLVARSRNHDTGTVCAIVDGVRVVHDNLKTLDKWAGPASKMSPSGNIDILQRNYADMVQTQQLHPADFQSTPRELKCVRAERAGSAVAPSEE